MFSLYGITGPTFTGSLEQLGEVKKPSRIRAVRAIADGVEHGPGVEAIHSYEVVVHPDLERGPLYHAHQVMNRDVIIVNADDDVAHAWQVFREHRIHQAPVLNSARQLVGILSESHILKSIDETRDRLSDTLDKRGKEQDR